VGTRGKGVFFSPPLPSPLIVRGGGGKEGVNPSRREGKVRIKHDLTFLMNYDIFYM